MSIPPADTAKRSLQPRSSPSIAPKPRQTLRPSGLQPLSNLRAIPSTSTHTGLKTLAQICRRDGDEDGDEDDREGGVQDTGLISKGRVVHHRHQSFVCAAVKRRDGFPEFGEIGTRRLQYGMGGGAGIIANLTCNVSS